MRKKGFRIQYRERDHSGKSVVRSATFDTAREAKEFKARRAAKKYDVALASSDRFLPTFRELADRWLVEVFAPSREPETVQATTGHLECHVYPAFGDVVVKDVSVELVDDLKNDLVRKGYAPQTVRNILSSTSKVFQYAVKIKKMIPANPVASIDKPRSISITGKKLVVWNKEQKDRFLAAVLRTYPDYHLMFLLEMMTGVRPGEVVAIRRGAIAFETGALTIRSTWGKVTKGPKGKTKTGSERTFILGPKILAALEGKRNLPPESLIFGGVSYNQVYYRMMRIVASEGLPRITPHKLRHTFINDMVNMPGNTLAMTAEIVGHANLRTTDAYYRIFSARGTYSTASIEETVTHLADAKTPEESGGRVTGGGEKPG